MHRALRIPFALTLLVGVLLVIFSSVVNPFRSVILNVVASPLVRFGTVRSAILQGAFFSRTDTDRAKLEAEALSLRAELDGARTILGGTDEDGAVEGIPAAIMLERVESISHTAMLNRGASHGVVVGNIVTFAGAELGVIRSVAEKTSVMEYVFAPLTETPAVFLASGIPVTLEGKGAGFFIAKLPHDANVGVGAVAVRSASARIVLGVVAEVRDNPASPFKEFLVRSPVNPHTVTYVFIR